MQLDRDLNWSALSSSYLWYTAWPDGENRYNATKQAAQSHALSWIEKGITDINQVDDAFAAIKQVGARTVIVQPSLFTYTQRGPTFIGNEEVGCSTIFAFPVAAKKVLWLLMAPTIFTCTVEHHSMFAVSGRAQTPPTCPWNSPPRSNCLSTLRPQRTLE